MLNMFQHQHIRQQILKQVQDDAVRIRLDETRKLG